MTTATAPPPAAVATPATAPRARWRRLLHDPPTWAVVVLVLAWGVPFTHAEGGTRAWATSWFLLLTAAALAVVRPWRRLPPAHLLALAPAVAAAVVCVAAPTGRDGLDELAALAAAGLTYLVVTAYLAGPDRALRAAVVLGCLLVAVADQAFAAWWPWYGGRDASELMVGTFYWHNQVAAFTGALGVLAAAVAVLGRGPLRVAAAVAAVPALPVLLHSGSRGGMLCAGLAWAVLLLVALRRSWRRTLVVVVLPLAGLALSTLLASPLLMDGDHGSGAAVAGRDQSAVGNGAARVDYTLAALRLAARHPLTGAGFDSFHPAGTPLLTEGSAPTTAVHNGFAQAFSDGGLLLGAAVLAATLAPFVLLLRRRAPVPSVAAVAAGLGLAVLATHSGLDLDWRYPSLVVGYAVLSALLVGALARPRARPDRPGRRRSAAAGVVLAVLVVALPASARAGVAAAPALDPPAWTRVAALGADPATAPAWTRGVSECRLLLQQELAGPARPEVLDDGLACTRRAAADAPSLRLLHARALTALGRVEEGRVLAERTAAEHGDLIPELVVGAAALPADAGDLTSARAALTAVLRDPRVAGDANATRLARAQLEALDHAGDGAGGDGS